jgi:hypothetical protein
MRVTAGRLVGDGRFALVCPLRLVGRYRAGQLHLGRRGYKRRPAAGRPYGGASPLGLSELSVGVVDADSSCRGDRIDVLPRFHLTLEEQMIA